MKEMASKKRKRGNNKPSIHPRNKYAENPPDFSQLASLYPSFSNFVFYSRDGRPRIDWTDFNATRELTKVLLHHDHGLNWWIPDGQLCPTVPKKSNYIHWIEDLLASDIIEKNKADGDDVRGFDIGTGANCIYPLLGASLLGWSFVGSALEWAEKNVKSNPHITDLVEIRRVRVDCTAEGGGVVDCSGNVGQPIELVEKKVDRFPIPRSKDGLEVRLLRNKEEGASLEEKRDEQTDAGPSTSLCEQVSVDNGYHGPPILVGVVKEGEKFDFCMCNSPFFESMEEAGLNPRTSCGGTPVEMVCPGGERAFINHIIEDSVVLKQSIR